MKQITKGDVWKTLKSECVETAEWLAAMRSVFGTPASVSLELDGNELINTHKQMHSEHEQSECGQTHWKARYRPRYMGR